MPQLFYLQKEDDPYSSKRKYEQEKQEPNLLTG